MSVTRKYRRERMDIVWGPLGKPNPLPEWAFEDGEVTVGPPDFTVRIPGGWVTAEALDEYMMSRGWRRVEPDTPHRSNPQ